MKRLAPLTAVAVAAVILAGCASVGIDDALKETNTVPSSSPAASKLIRTRNSVTAARR